MRSRDTRRATYRAILPPLLHRWIAIAILLTIVVCLVVPAQVLAYNENMMELVVASNPPIIVQNQSYSTSTRQNLFHTATNAASDTEAFAFSGLSPTGIDLAQTSSFTGAGTETGYFMSTASADLVAPVHIGNGYLGTWIGDPLWSGVPVFTGIIFPQMTKVNPAAMASPPAGLQPAVSSVPATGNATGNKTRIDTSMFQPVINYDLNNTLSAESAGNAANATKQNATAKNATSKPATSPSPAIKRGQPFYHQQNKPFSTALTSPSGPFKSTPEKIENTSSVDRFLMNTVGRSTTDKAFNGTTSSPTYIMPAEALAVQIPYDFIQGARGMTMPGTHLNCRAWPL